MPIVTVHGIPHDADDRTGISVMALGKELKRTVAEVAALDITEDLVTVHVPDERNSSLLKLEVTAHILIFAKPERTKNVQDDLARRVVTLLVKYVREYYGSTPYTIEVFVHPFVFESQGFATMGSP